MHLSTLHVSCSSEQKSCVPIQQDCKTTVLRQVILTTVEITENCDNTSGKCNKDPLIARPLS